MCSVHSRDNGDNVKSLGRISVPLKGLSAEGVSEEVCKELPPWNGQPGGKIRLKFRLKVQIVSLAPDVGQL